MVYLLFILGLILIIKGGDLFVDAAAWMAEATGIPKFVVGATIVSIATTLPELFVSIISVAQGSVEMGVGNAVGSVICNLGVILGIGLLLMAGPVARRELTEKGMFMALAAGILFFLLSDGRLTHAGSLILFALLAGYIALSLRSMRKAETRPNAIRPPKPDGRAVGCNLGKFALGTSGILIGADLLVDNGCTIARMAGVSEAVIGLTLVALGTSLPELVTMIAAVIKKESALSVGNIIGANVMDLTMILSTCAFLSPAGLPVTPATVSTDLPFTLALTAIFLLPPLFTRKFMRWQGAALLLTYAGYVHLLVAR